MIESTAEWSYNNTRQWVRKNRYCAGHSQSPIDLQFNLSRYNDHLKQISFEEQDSQGKYMRNRRKMTIDFLSNRTNGIVQYWPYRLERYPFNHSLIFSVILAQMSIKNRYLLKNIAPASEDYKVEQLHFHWGHSNNDLVGSEHLHEGQSYPLEVRTHCFD